MRTTTTNTTKAASASKAARNLPTIHGVIRQPRYQTIIIPMALEDRNEFIAFMREDSCFRHPETSVEIGTKDSEVMKPFNRRTQCGISQKRILAEMKERLFSGVRASLELHLPMALWERVERYAAFYGITPAEHCMSCIGYHVELSRRRTREKAKPNPFQSFERGLARDARTERRTAKAMATAR